MKLARQLVFVGATFLVVILSSKSTWGQELLDDDTIVVSVFDDLGPPPPFEDVKRYRYRVKRETLTGSDGSTVTINCKTVRNQEGHCKPFNECYPLFKLRNLGTNSESEREEIKNYARSETFELEWLYRNASGPCSEQMLNAIAKVTIGKSIPKNEYVCCPDTENFVYRERPSRPPAAPTVETLDNKCGRTFDKFKTQPESELGNNTSVEEIEDEVETTTGSQLYREENEEIFRIVNGRIAGRGEFPWAVAMMNRGRQFCGGSLISNNHILTAAHCVSFMNRNDVDRMTINIGDHNVYSTSDGPHQVRKASNIYYHRGFTMKTLFHDVAVIRLSKPVTFTRNIQPVCISNGNTPYDNGNAYADVAGWGQLSLNGQQSPVLRTVKVRVMRQNDCVKAYRGKAPTAITSGMVCAGGGGKDSCKGDSGGPLTITRKNFPATQIGVVSWGIGCATYPGVYTRVDQYLPWINKNRR